mmetsp:Transcript_84618/g.244586  ORF Transcript_84618/g.244586 Transcript_84618/m.244586 type:complete len:222 (+) Transcript_84618:394-1059(+)
MLRPLPPRRVAADAKPAATALVPSMPLRKALPKLSNGPLPASFLPRVELSPGSPPSLRSSSDAMQRTMATPTKPRQIAVAPTWSQNVRLPPAAASRCRCSAIADAALPSSLNINGAGSGADTASVVVVTVVVVPVVGSGEGACGGSASRSSGNKCKTIVSPPAQGPSASPSAPSASDQGGRSDSGWAAGAPGSKSGSSGASVAGASAAGSRSYTSNVLIAQ